MYTLVRLSDKAGDSGGDSKAISWTESGNVKEILPGKPRLNYSVYVGSLTARSYSQQDYWLTTPVTEIIEELKNEDYHYVRFKTINSEYEWWTGNYPKKNE